jgi:hypothetical protein
MKFFAPPPPPPGRIHEPVAEVRHPWLGPPETTLAGVVPIEFVLARTDDTVIAVSGVRAYPTGFVFTVHVRLRTDPGHAEWMFGHGDPFHCPPLVKGGLPDELMRVGLRFADGRTVTTLDRDPFGAEDPRQPPEGPVLLGQGGGGGGRTWDMDFWVWPLPPAGAITFAAEWPARQIPETLVEIDGGPIREAASRAVELWPDDVLS